MKKKILAIVQITVLLMFALAQIACNPKTVAEYTADAYSGLNQFIQYCGTLNRAGKLSDDRYRAALTTHDKILTSLDHFKDRARTFGTVDQNNKQELITFIAGSVTDAGNLFNSIGVSDPILTTAIGLIEVGLTGVQTWLAGIIGPVTVTAKIVAEFDYYYKQRLDMRAEEFRMKLIERNGE